MKKLFILLSGFSLFCFASYSQSVGINTDASLPHASSMLDVKSINKGLLIPRITLTSTSDVITITSPAVSLMVYNTTAAGGGPTAVTPGFYFWNGTAWERLTPAAGISGSGTTNFVPKFTAATTLGNSAIFESGGNVGIGTTSPTDLLEVARNGSLDLGIHFGWNKMVLTNLHNMGIANNASHSIGSRILFKGYKDAALSAPQNIYSLGIDVFGNTISSVEKNNFFIRDEYASGSPVRFLIDATGNIGIGSTSPLQKLQVAGDINMETGGGIRINNTATSGQYLRGNGTKFISSAIQVGDIPAGSGNYIQNQTAADQAAGFRINGNGLFNGGNVGIGTISPVDRLEVAREGSIDLGGHFGWNKMVLTNLHNMGSANGGNHSIGSKILFRGYKDAALSSPQNIYSLGIDVFGDVTSSVEKNNFFIRDEYASGFPVRFLIDADGNVGIGTTSPIHPLHMASGAHVTAGGVWTNASSREYKEDISTLEVEEALEALTGLEPKKYKYKNDKEENHIGFIAEDVPELVATKDRKGLSPMDIVAVLTKVVQQQQKRIEILETKLNKEK